MTNEKNKQEVKKPVEFQKYAFANVAAQLSKDKEDPEYINGAVSLLEKNLDFGADGVDLYKQYVSDKATNKLIDIYNKKYQSKLVEASVSDMASFYEPALKGASEQQKNLILSEFGKLAGENYGKLMQKINSLAYLMQAPEGAIPNEQKEKAKKDLEKYAGFINAQQTLEKYNYELMRYQAVEASKKSAYGNLEKTLLEINKPKENKGEH